MSLINCSECNCEISDKAKVCPKCGCPLEMKKNKNLKPNFNIKKTIIFLIMIIICILIIYIFCFRKLSTSEIAKLSESIVTLYVYDENDEIISTGSGFITYNDKTIVTNFHVIKNGYKIEAKSDKNNVFPIDYVSFYDSSKDVAVLKTKDKTGIKTLKVKKNAGLNIGDKIYAIGSPLGLENTFSEGIVSAIRDNDSYSDIQITAPISAGSSGGALINEKGKVVGITYASYSDGQNLNLAIPSEEFVEKIKLEEQHSLEDLATFFNPIGNTRANYATSSCRLVRFKDKVFESYNSKKEIFENSNGERKSLGIFGEYLNIHNGKLYYISSNDSKKIGCYNLETGESINNILEDYSITVPFYSINSLFVTDNGISICATKKNYIDSVFIQLDFSGNVIGTLDLDSCFGLDALLDENTLLVSDYENWGIKVISTVDVTSTFIQLDFEPAGSIYTFKDSEVIYIADSTDSNDMGNIVEYNCITGDKNYIYIDKSDTWGTTFEDNIAYYDSLDGTSRLNIITGDYEILTSEYKLNNIIIDNGFLYGIGRKTEDDQYALDYMEYYVKINLKTKELELIESYYNTFWGE